MQVKTAKQCSTLREYREQVLGMSQKKVGVRAGCSGTSAQARISHIECGNTPRRWNWKPYLEAYQLSAKEFERLVIGQRRTDAMKKPMSETDPLFAAVLDAMGATTPEQISRATNIINALAAQKMQNERTA